jgi:hypothetical protein
MDTSALHPFDPRLAEPFVRAVITGDAVGELPGIDRSWSAYISASANAGYERALAGQERGFHQITSAFGQVAAAIHPTFVQEGLSLTAWEAQVDRGAGMLLRPPARLFIEAGLDPTVARKFAIRLDTNLGMMGGSYIPPRLMPQFAALIDNRFDRLVKRLVAAEMDPLPIMSILIEATTYATERGLGLFETLGVIVPDAPESFPPGSTIVVFDKKRVNPELRARIEIAAKPPKEQGRLGRLLGRGKSTPLDEFPTTMNGHVSDDE